MEAVKKQRKVKSKAAEVVTVEVPETPATVQGEITVTAPVSPPPPAPVLLPPTASVSTWVMPEAYGYAAVFTAPGKAKPTVTKSGEPRQQASPPQGGKYPTFHGLSPAAVARWLGGQKVTASPARRAMRACGIECSDATVQTQVQVGRRDAEQGKYVQMPDEGARLLTAHLTVNG